MSQPFVSVPWERVYDGAASPVSGPTVLIMVWPEYGHVVTLLALAKQLRERRCRVVFAGVRTFEQPMRALGYEYANLSAARPGAEPTLFDYLPHRAAFQSAVTHFIDSFRAALSSYSPDLILFDSLYSAFGTLACARATWLMAFGATCSVGIAPAFSKRAG